MKRSLLILSIVVALLNTAASAFSPMPEEILPGQKNGGPEFEMTPERLSTGEIKFTVTLIPQQSFSLSDYHLWLSSVRVRKTDRSASRLSFPVRTLTGILHENVITCVFVVTDQELENPELTFRFMHIDPAVPRNGFDVPFYRYAHLKNFVKP